MQTPFLTYSNKRFDSFTCSSPKTAVGLIYYAKDRISTVLDRGYVLQSTNIYSDEKTNISVPHIIACTRNMDVDNNPFDGGLHVLPQFFTSVKVPLTGPDVPAGMVRYSPCAPYYHTDMHIFSTIYPTLPTWDAPKPSFFYLIPAPTNSSVKRTLLFLWDSERVLSLVG